MKKLFFLFGLVLWMAQLSAANVLNGNEEVTASAVPQAAMYIDGPSSLQLDNSGYVGFSYVLQNAPAHAVLEWSIVGSGRCYCYPNGALCTVSLYGAGSYRLVCDVYVDGVRIDGVTKYITATPQ